MKEILPELIGEYIEHYEETLELPSVLITPDDASGVLHVNAILPRGDAY